MVDYPVNRKIASNNETTHENCQIHGFEQIPRPNVVSISGEAGLQLQHVSTVGKSTAWPLIRL